MSSQALQLFPVFGFFVVLLFITGVYCMLVSRNLIRMLIGLEILIKAVTLLIIVVGYITQKTALTQVLVITIIVIEVVLAAVACGVALSVYRQTDTLEATRLRNMKG